MPATLGTLTGHWEVRNLVSLGTKINVKENVLLTLFRFKMSLHRLLVNQNQRMKNLCGNQR